MKCNFFNEIEGKFFFLVVFLFLLKYFLFYRAFDTTNRNAVIWAEKDGFDAQGFKQEIPLQKSIFYFNPYVTCTNCNLVNFIDSYNLRRKMQFPSIIKDQIPVEYLPGCKQCGRADCYEVGAFDYASEIERKKM